MKKKRKSIGREQVKSMQAKLDHVAIAVKDFEWVVNFFKEVFGMEIEKSQGDIPIRKAWFREGIQVNESHRDIAYDDILNHIGIKANFKEEICIKSEKLGCKRLAKQDYWIQLPNGIVIELK